MRNRMWRLNNIYTILNKEGKEIPFRMNWAQNNLYESMWYRNVILKARQHGFTTLIGILGLDTCIFHPNIRAGFIAHNLDDANVIFRDKIVFSYERLPASVRREVRVAEQTKSQITFSNNSSIRVSTSMRSGTVQFLHISELGKIAAKYPEKAIEIRSGAIEAVPKDGMVFIESTAEGREGEFYEACATAQRLEQTGSRLTPLDFKFHFVPWFWNPEYALDPEGVVITDRMDEYFRRLVKEHGITLTQEQKAWYVRKEATQREQMKREYPATPEEAFEGSVEGAYYLREMNTLRQQGRIGNFPYIKGLPCYALWDLGYDDSTAIWLMQPVGGRRRLIKYMEDRKQSFDYYADKLRELEIPIMGHYMPHDIEHGSVGNIGGLTDRQVAEQCGIHPIHTVERAKNNAEVLADIRTTRMFLSQCEIDQQGCEEGIKCLDNYRSEWDEKLSKFRDKPRHDWTSHGADALRSGAVGFDDPHLHNRAPRILGVAADDSLLRKTYQ